MLTKRNKCTSVVLLLLFGALQMQAQHLSGVYKTAQLFQRISSKDTVYVLNFWATWCKPCMEELTSIDSVGAEYKGSTTKLIFVNLDFIEKKQRVDQVLKQKHIVSECVLLDEVNGNEYIDAVHKDWSGDIPATVLISSNRKLLLNKKLSAEQLRKAIANFATTR